MVELRPDERIAFTWNFPPSLPTIRDARTLIQIDLAPVPGQPDRTFVTLTQKGFRAGLEWDQGRRYFDKAWSVVLDRLQQRFLKGPIDWSAP